MSLRFRARGTHGMPERRSSSNEGIPCWSSKSDKDKPAPPAPTIKTGTCSLVIVEFLSYLSFFFEQDCPWLTVLGEEAH